MKQIYLVDYIGNHSGMHYYLEAFREVIAMKGNSCVKILSNYDYGFEKAFFLNHYKGKIIQKVFSLLINLFRLYRFTRRHRKDCFIYLTYGNIIDLLFMRIVATCPNHIVDIHEVIAQNIDSKTWINQYFKKLYNTKIKTVISHSQRTDDFLNKYNAHPYKFNVPHFKYIFPKKYNTANIDSKVLRCIEKDKINLLFFGNLNENKGIDILLDAVNKLPIEEVSKLNVIVAGKDFDGSVDRIHIKEGREVKFFRRHITDDELRFLYQKVDYLALPYRKTSQSGILEMAFYFKKPIIASDVPYFRSVLEKFPSFGELSNGPLLNYYQTLQRVIVNHGTIRYFKDEDYARYENREEIIKFSEEFHKWINE